MAAVFGSEKNSGSRSYLSELAYKKSKKFFKSKWVNWGLQCQGRGFKTHKLPDQYKNIYVIKALSEI